MINPVTADGEWRSVTENGESGDAVAAGPRQVQRIASYALVVRDNAVLLARLNDRTAYPGSWTLPGGGIDFGEAPVDGVLRELHEETGLTGRVTALLGVMSAVRERGTGGPDRFNALRVLYRVEVDEVGPLQIHDVDGTTDAVEWVALSEVDARPRAPLVDFALARIEHGGALP
jgi:8-oxo-dGTP diphosphatase